jgi:hypothetical protein
VTNFIKNFGITRLTHVLTSYEIKAPTEEIQQHNLRKFVARGQRDESFKEAYSVTERDSKFLVRKE